MFVDLRRLHNTQDTPYVKYANNVHYIRCMEKSLLKTAFWIEALWK